MSLIRFASFTFLFVTLRKARSLPSFIEDVTAFTEALGPENPGIVLPLATVHWPTGAARDEFISALIKSQGGELDV